MKYLSSIILAAVFLTAATFAPGQTQTQVDAAGKKLKPSGAIDQAGLSTVARGLMNQRGKIILQTDTSGNLVVPNTTNNFTYTLSFGTPTQNRTVAIPVGGGTLVTTPTTLVWRFTGATYNVDLTQREPTVGSAIVYLPDPADVDTALVPSTLTTNGIGVANSIWFASNSLIAEGTANGSEITVDFADATADVIYRFPDTAAATLGIVASTLATNGVGIANSVTMSSNSIEFEGTVDAHEIHLTSADATADAIYQFLDAPAGTYPVVGNVVQARTATADGLTTGIIAPGATHVTVTSASADNIIVLPAPVVGKQIVIDVGATGFELRSSAPDTIAINGGTGSAAESAIAANSTIIAICISATAWKAIFLDADADVAKVEAAAP